MRQGFDRTITQKQDYMTDRRRHIFAMTGLAVIYMIGSLVLSVNSAHAATVFLVCDGNFKTIKGVSDSRAGTKGAHASIGSSYYNGNRVVGQQALAVAAKLDKNIPTEDEFTGTFYLSIDGSEGVFSRVKLQPFERDDRLPSLDL